jgi:hypothetical protein
MTKGSKKTVSQPAATALPVVQLKCKSFTVNQSQCIVELHHGDDETLGVVVKAYQEYGRREFEFELDDGTKKDTYFCWISNFAPYRVVLGFGLPMANHDACSSPTTSNQGGGSKV